MNTRSVISYPANEPILEYRAGTPERALLQKAIADLRAAPTEIPIVINGVEIKTGKVGEQNIPHDHKHVLARYHQAGAAEIQSAIDASLKARAAWAAMPMDHRLAIFLKAADLLAGPWRYKMLAATILGQSKNYFQAEIDCICEVRADLFCARIIFFSFTYVLLNTLNISPCKYAAPSPPLCWHSFRAVIFRNA